MSYYSQFFGGGGGGGIPQAPLALPKKINSKNLYGLDLPIGDDGSYVGLPVSNNPSQALQYHNAAGALVWSVLGTDISSAVNFWSGFFWYDTVDAAIWAMPYDTVATPDDDFFLAKIDIATGAITNVATVNGIGIAYFLNNFKSYYTERASMGSGDFTMIDGDWKVVFSSIDGSLTSGPTQLLQNGAAASPTAGYITEDGAVRACGQTSVFTLDLIRGGAYVRIYTSTDAPVCSGGYYVLWNDYVALAAYGSNESNNGRFFNRSEFDAWLVELCDFYGLPE